MDPIEGYLHFKCHLGKKRKREEINGGCVSDLVDFILKPVGSNEDDEFLVSFPLSQLQLAAKACQNKAMVRINRYTLTPLSSNRVSCSALIEVFSDGLECCVDLSTSQKDGKSDDYWSLQQVARLEALDALENTHCSIKSFTIKARIGAVSPLITTDPTDVFALIEITDYDDDFAGICVVRLQALSHLRGFCRGDKILLRNVMRIRWDVPTRIKENFHVGPIPQNVFLVQHPQQIGFQGTCHRNQPSVTGCIKQEYRIRCNHTNQLHYLEVAAQHDSNDSIFIYLTYFPMPISLQLSLRRGAIIAAFNLKQIDRNCWAACIRSTVEVLKMNGECPGNNSADDEVLDQVIHPDRRAAPHEPIHFASPYRFRNIRRTYQDFWVGKHVMTWVADFHVPKAKHKTLPTIASIVEAILPRDSRKLRDPFVEFFDAASSPPHNLPRFATIQLLHVIALTDLKDRLKCYLDNLEVELPIGWNGSFVLDGQSLRQRCGVSADRGVLMSGGFLARTWNQGMPNAFLTDGRAILPFVGGSTLATISTDFIVEAVRSLIVSCVYCGDVSVVSNASNGFDLQPLPFHKSDWTDYCCKGPCFVVVYKGHVFIASLVVECSQLSKDSTSTKAVQDSFVDPTEAGASQSDAFMDAAGPNSEQIEAIKTTYMVRKMFKFGKASSNVYNGCNITSSMLKNVWTSCMQSIDFRPLMTIETSMRKSLENISRSLLSIELSPEQLSFCSVVYQMACDERVCSVLVGGWDELADPNGSCADLAVQITIPSSTWQRDPKRGYLRIRCSMDQLVATVVRVRKCSYTSDSSPLPYSFIGGRRFLPGMLDLRPKRRQRGKLATGELLFDVHESVTPVSTLSDLFLAMCRDLSSCCRINLSPTHVRKIKGASFLGISYCAARAECTQCFQALHFPRRQKVAAMEGVVTSIEKEYEPQSFWNTSVPLSRSSQQSGGNPTKAAPRKTNATGRRSTNLVCPNGCQVQRSGAVKWECSGTLDDGSGQVKLYAERDVALMLLGMDTQTVAFIEEGAWKCENGILFSRQMLPKENIREAILKARLLALNDYPRRKITEQTILNYLAPLTRAQYLLQWHCRFSPEPKRSMNYYVRCKPVSDDSSHVHHSEVEVVSVGIGRMANQHETPTYTLPSLKLVLVDCSSSLGTNDI